MHKSPLLILLTLLGLTPEGKFGDKKVTITANGHYCVIGGDYSMVDVRVTMVECKESRVTSAT